MTDCTNIRVGLAGWNNPPRQRSLRQPAQSHLSHYAAHFSCVEINSSFYRPHRNTTYARWRDETPAGFRFSVKMPRSITHESGLKRCAGEVAQFYEAIRSLQPKLAAVLVQLPPGLEFERRAARAFFHRLPKLQGTALVCEPRHPSWFTQAADDTLQSHEVSRVAADPARGPGAETPGGFRRFAYWRWHGTPRLYYSSYTDGRLGAFAEGVRLDPAADAWCVFDNTALHAAWGDGIRFCRAMSLRNHRATLSTAV